MMFRDLFEFQRQNQLQPTQTRPTLNTGSVTFRLDEWVCDSIGGFCRQSMVLDANLTLISSTGGAAKGGGVKLLDFPTGLLLPYKAKISGTFQLTGAGTNDTTAGEMGLGTVVGSGAVAVLGGTATFENILEGGIPALGNAVGGGAAVAILTGDTVRSEIGTITTAQALYLNAASTFAAGTGTTTFVACSGTRIDVWYSILG